MPSIEERIADLEARLTAFEDRHRGEDFSAMRADLAYCRQTLFKFQTDTITQFSAVRQVQETIMKAMATKFDLAALEVKVDGLDAKVDGLAGDISVIRAWVNRQPD